MLRALQDDSLTWLANIPVSGLVELRERLEHSELRDHLKKITAQLTSAEAPELEAVVREVRHGLEVLITGAEKIDEGYRSPVFGKELDVGSKGRHWRACGREHVLFALACGNDRGYGSNSNGPRRRGRRRYEHGGEHDRWGHREAPCAEVHARDVGDG